MIHMGFSDTRKFDSVQTSIHEPDRHGERSCTVGIRIVFCVDYLSSNPDMLRAETVTFAFPTVAEAHKGLIRLNIEANMAAARLKAAMLELERVEKATTEWQEACREKSTQAEVAVVAVGAEEADDSGE